MRANADAAIRWLLEGDPSIRWQTLRDMAGARERSGAPSHWNTLRALRVIRWWEIGP